MGIPITPDDPIDGGTPTCATFMPDTLDIIIDIISTGVWTGALPRIIPGLNFWFAELFTGPFPLDVNVSADGVDGAIRVDLFQIPTFFEFTDQNCDFPLTGTGEGPTDYTIVDGT